MKALKQTSRLVTLALAALVSVAGPALGAGPDRDCADGRAAVGYIGIDGLSCNCTVTSTRNVTNGEDTGARRVWKFRGEPTILHIANDSPAEGNLEAGDIIVSINGAPITTRKAGNLYGDPPPLEPMGFVVRRSSELVEVTVIPEAVCPDDPRIDYGPVAPVAPTPPPPPRVVRLGELPRLEAPAPPAAPDVNVLPRGWLGMGISCEDCVVKLGGDYPGWQFTSPPVVYSVDAGSPAERAGLRAGDVLTHIDDIPLVERDGAERFTEIRPGQELTWQIERDGKVRVVHMTAGQSPVPRAAESPVGAESPVAPPAPLTPGTTPTSPTPPQPPEPHKLRFTGSLGDTSVDVWGIASVVVTMDEERGEVIIKTGTATIRLKAKKR